MKSITVKIPKEILKKVQEITGKEKNASAIKTALSQWLENRGMSYEMQIGSGGNRIESSAYQAGIAWGKKAKIEGWDIDMFADGALADSQKDFEEWGRGFGMKSSQYQSCFEAWGRGTAKGYEA